MSLRVGVIAWGLVIGAGMAFAQGGSPAPVPVKVTLCWLLAHPSDWNRKLVQITGFASHGFEDSTFWLPECGDRYGGIWMEYGGSRATGTMSSVSNYLTVRSAPLVVDGVVTSLVEDAVFHRLNELVHVDGGPASVHTKAVGWFFAAKGGDSRDVGLGGYGHMGCCNLLVLRQVLTVDEVRDKTLDRNEGGRSPNWPSTHDLVRLGRYRDMVKAQKETEAGAEGRSFTDPLLVARAFLVHVAGFSKEEALQLRELGISSPEREVYVGTISGTTKANVRVVVSRPAWLSFYAKDPARVAWVVIGDYADDRIGPDEGHGSVLK